MSHQPIEHCGQTLWLLADKAIYWPARRALLVADLHIGKAASYRALHQPVPRGTTAATLARLDACWQHTTASNSSSWATFSMRALPAPPQRWPGFRCGGSGMSTCISC